jgi:hypothetical protein
MTGNILSSGNSGEGVPWILGGITLFVPKLPPLDFWPKST